MNLKGYMYDSNNEEATILIFAKVFKIYSKYKLLSINIFYCTFLVI